MASVRGAARRYAEALFAIGREQETFDTWLADLERVQQLLADPTAEQVLTSPAVPEEDRREALDRLLPELRPEAHNFLHLLVGRERLDLVPEILSALRDLVDEAHGIVTARVTSAVQLDARMQELVAERLTRYAGRAVRLEVSVDAELIGGVVARIGDELIDDSVRGRLQRLKARLAQAPVG